MNSKLLIEESPLQVLPSLVVALDSLSDGIFLQQLHWMLGNSGKVKIIDGVRWIRNSAEDWKAEKFPFWSIQTIARIITSLVDKKVVITRHDLNEYKGDRTTWATIDYKALNSLLSDSEKPSIENKKPFPKNDKSFPKNDKSSHQVDQMDLSKMGNQYIEENLLREKEEGEIASAGSLPPSLLPDGNTFQDQGIAQPQATPIPPVAVAPLSPVAQALADAANEQFEDRQPQGNEYLPGLEKPKKNKQAKISEINTAAARQFGIDAKTFRLMVDAYLTGMGELIAANGTGQMATEIHQNAQSTVLEIIETSVVKFPDETAIAKLFKSYKSYNSWQDSKPSKMQLFKHASGIAAGMFSIDGMPAPTGQAQPAQGSKWQKQPAASTTAEQMAARMNVFNKPYVAEK